MTIQKNENEIIEFLTKRGLYTRIPIEYTFESDSIHFPKIDIFCQKCNKRSTFVLDEEQCFIDKMKVLFRAKRSGMRVFKPNHSGLVGLERELPQINPLNNNSILAIKMKCARNYDHLIFFIFLVIDGYLIKIGQHPSIEDIQSPIDSKTVKIITEKNYSELRRARGLFAHGIGIGSFVYLRRIIEDLITETTKIAIVENTISKEDIEGKRWYEQIKLLKGYLPDIMVDNPIVYSVLSKGIHELTENECLQYFPTIRELIELIFAEKVAMEEKEHRIKEISHKMSAINSKIKVSK
ncbi:MAG: hypothetical protein P9X24_05760 [Candidatus Hatepunaea meridiana]|nr:hypothetical protein [Candidatus Hatepunaea meridiana]